VKARYLAVAGLAAALAVAGCSSSGGGTANNTTSPSSGGSSSSSPASQQPSSAAPDSASGTLTVWLMTDAQQGWPNSVAAATTDFNKKFPNVKVDVQYQTWGDHLAKLDTALAATPPDVVELGNTEMTKYMANGALADLTNDKSKFDTSDTWLKALADSVTYNDKVYGVPYYAGARGVIYRTDQFQAVGITAAPTTLDEFVADGKKLVDKYGSDPNYSALYWPGKNWYGAMSFVYGYGGSIAKNDGGKWTGNLESAESQAGLTELKTIVEALSRAPKDGDESKQDSVMAQGHVGMIYGNGWEVGSVTAPKDKGGNPDLKIDAFPLPGKDAGTPLPSFLGGSDLVIPATSKNTAWAEEWINDFTGKDGMTRLVNEAKAIPNTTSLLSLLGDSPFAKAASNSWFVPTAPNWADVESQNVLQTMLANIFTGKKSIADATKAADQQINSILNGS
jgi:N,N'-diacetylchitobiose transport system substrate-binding protein